MTFTRRGSLLALGGAGAALLAKPGLLRAQSLRTIADTMAGDTRFTQFLDLITRASMVQDFRAATPMTVFAPVDQAFFGAPAALLQDLTGQNNRSPENRNDGEDQRLMALIRYHMVPGMFSPTELAGTDRRLRTLNGADVAISSSGGALTVTNPAPAQQIGGFGAAGAQASFRPGRLTGTPVTASNGVIYPIDQILWP